MTWHRGFELYPRRNKFNAHHVWIDGIEFASKAEGAYYRMIRNEWTNGWSRQERFEIVKAFRCGHKRYAHATYRPDFVHRTNGVIDKVVDVKGGNVTLTTDARLRMKLFMMRYGVPITIARYDYHSGIFEEELI